MPVTREEPISAENLNAVVQNLLGGQSLTPSTRWAPST